MAGAKCSAISRKSRSCRRRCGANAERHTASSFFPNDRRFRRPFEDAHRIGKIDACPSRPKQFLRSHRCSPASRMRKCEVSRLAPPADAFTRTSSCSPKAIPARGCSSWHGKVRIFKLSPSGREQILAVEGPGSSFAELPVFDGGNYPAAAAALEDTEVLFVSRKDFQNFCREHPDV